MRRFVGALVLLAACSATPEAATRAEALRAWDSVDPAFAGCQGSCGAHADGPSEDVVPQPARAIGQRTYCPVSGAIFTIDDARPHAEVGGHTFYFCCAACAAYFEAHRDAVLRARGIALTHSP